MSEPKHTMGAVAIQTGLTPHTIRAWERRYRALAPDRTATNRRLYSAEDIERLLLMRRATQAGHSIGQVAGLSTDELRSLPVGVVRPEAPVRQEVDAGVGYQADAMVHECLQAIRLLDSAALEGALQRASSGLGATAFVQQVAIPLLRDLGDLWRSGRLRSAQEHMGTAALRTLLGRMLQSLDPPEGAPCLVATTPVGQVHEMGALVVAVTAASEGWRVLYLGANLPSEEIAGAAHQAGARAVALSILYPPDDPRLPGELESLGRQLGPGVALVVGGRHADAYRESLARVGAVIPGDLGSLRTTLEALRTR